MRIILLVLLALLAACGEVGNEEFDTETREVSLFSQVENRGEANVYLIVDAAVAPQTVRLTISGDENLLDDVQAWVSSGRLIVATDDHLWPHFELKLVATVPALDSVEADGSGNVEVLGLSGSDFNVSLSGSGDAIVSGHATQVTCDASGSGDIHLDGTVDHLDVAASGSGDVRGLGMQARIAEVHASGSGDVKVCVTERLEAHLSGSGDIDYGCHPDHVFEHDSGSGDIGPC